MKMPEIPEIPTDNLYKFMAISGLVLIAVSFIPKYYWYQLSIEKIRLSRDIAKYTMSAKGIMEKDYEQLVQVRARGYYFGFLNELLLHGDAWFDTQGGNKFDELFHGEAKDIHNRLKMYRPFGIELEMSGLEGEALVDFYKGIRENAKKVFRNDIVEEIVKTEDEALIEYLEEIRWQGKSIFRKDVVGIFERVEVEVINFCYKDWEVPKGSTFLEYEPVTTEKKEYAKFLESHLQVKSEYDEINTKSRALSILLNEMYALRVCGILVCCLGFYFWYMRLQRFQDIFVKDKALSRMSNGEAASKETEGVSTDEIVEEHSEPEATYDS